MDGKITRQRRESCGKQRKMKSVYYSINHLTCKRTNKFIWLKQYPRLIVVIEFYPLGIIKTSNVIVGIISIVVVLQFDRAINPIF